MSAECSFVDESGTTEPVKVLSCGLVCHAYAITNFVESEARVIGEELEDLDAAVVSRAFHNPLPDVVLDFIHEGYNWSNGGKLRSLGEIFSFRGGSALGRLAFN
jgi:hypothetical protein